MVFFTLKLIVFFKKKFSEISNFKVSLLFCLIVTKPCYELENNRFYLVNYKLFCLFSVLSDAILTLLLNFVFLNGHKFFDEINVCCCCLILSFVFARFLNICISHQSNASFFTPLSYLLWRLSFRSYASFFEKNLIFCVFLSVPHLVDNYAKIEWGRNLLCGRNLLVLSIC